MSEHSPWVVIWTASDAVHAHLMLTELASVGIDAHVTQEHLGGLGFLAPGMGPGVEVRECDQERGLRLLQELAERMAEKRRRPDRLMEEPQNRGFPSLFWRARGGVEAMVSGFKAAETFSGRGTLPYGVHTIVSGGQTGADQAALLWALHSGVSTAGWVPAGRLAEDGEIPPEIPGLIETESTEPRERTQLNVRDSDATVVVSLGAIDGGSALALRWARELGKPTLQLELRSLGLPAATEAMTSWLALTQPGRLNVAGPRASNEPELGQAVTALLNAVFLSDASEP